MNKEYGVKGWLELQMNVKKEMTEYVYAGKDTPSTIGNRKFQMDIKAT